MLPLLAALLGPAQADDVSWYVVPNLSFDTDDGLGFGVRGELARKAEGYAPYRDAWVAHAYGTVRGYHHHRLRYDRTGIGRSGARLTAHLAWRQWSNDGYWGMGPGAAREAAWVGDFEADDPRRKRYRYKLVQPFTHLTWRQPITGPWSAYGALNGRYSAVRTYEGSLLEQQRPYGMDGGLTVQVSGGLLYDTREPEVCPERGLLLEVSGRWALGSAGEFGGPFASARGFVSTGDRVVLGGRVMGEWLRGQVPFYEQVHWGGLVPVAGFGGADTVRGLPFGRFRAPGKAVANVEARIDFLRHTAAGKPFRWQAVPYVDVGAVWGAPAAGPAPPWAPAVGLGLRAVFDDTFVGRLDVGAAPDPVVEAEGTLDNPWGLGVYVVFDQAF